MYSLLSHKMDTRLLPPPSLQFSHVSRISPCLIVIPVWRFPGPSKHTFHHPADSDRHWLEPRTSTRVWRGGEVSIHPVFSWLLWVALPAISLLTALASTRGRLLSLIRQVTNEPAAAYIGFTFKNCLGHLSGCQHERFPPPHHRFL